MNQIFKENFSALKEFDPSLAQYLAQHFEEVTVSPPFTIEPDQGKDLTVKIDGRQLTSHHNRQKQAELALEQTDCNTDLYIYGFGLGDELRVAIRRQATHTFISIFLLNPDLFYYLLWVDDEIKDLFIKGRVKFSIAEDETRVFSNHIIIFPELYLNPRYLNHLKTKLILLLDQKWAEYLFERTVGICSDNIIRANIPYLKKETPLTPAVLAQHDKFLILGAGPSLQKQSDLIPLYRKRGFKIIAVDTALKFLEEEKIIPDYIFSVDINIGNNNIGKDFFINPTIYKDSTLIFGPATSPKVFSDFPGKRYYLVNQRAVRINPSLNREYVGLLDMKGSVLLSALTFAVKCRPVEIALLGADFAYLDNQSHAGITGVAKFTTGDSKIMVLCNDGKMQRSQHNFVLYKTYLEETISNNPEIRFINLSKTGAVIKGALRS